MCRECFEVDLGFTCERFPVGTHMCMVYSDEEERKEVISRFIAKGIADGEKVAYFADDTARPVIEEWLAGLGIKEAKTFPNFKITDAQQTYCPNGSFVPDEMIETLKKYYKDARAENYNACRVSGEMGWAVKGLPGSERLMEYEAKVNELTVDYPVTAICQYDASKFDGATIFECLKVHPHMIVKGQIVQNPYYITPKEYLKNARR